MTMWRILTPVAQKSHQCEMCLRTIDPGERYLRGSGLYDGHWFGWAECRHCQVFRDLADLYDPCGDDGYDRCCYTDAEFSPGSVEAEWQGQFLAKWRDATGELVPVPTGGGESNREG